ARNEEGRDQGQGEGGQGREEGDQGRKGRREHRGKQGGRRDGVSRIDVTTTSRDLIGRGLFISGTGGTLAGTPLKVAGYEFLPTAACAASCPSRGSSRTAACPDRPGDPACRGPRRGQCQPRD